MLQALRMVLKRMHDPLEAMLVCVRCYAAYPLSLRHIEEMMVERGVFVDHATVHRHPRGGPPGNQEDRAANDGLQSVRCARIIVAGFETMHMIKKGQLDCPNAQASSAASRFYSRAF